MLGALWLSAAAATEIRINQATFYNGWLIVSGELLPKAQSQNVTLNGKFTTNIDANGRFAFRVQHLPFLCAAVVRIGDVERTRKVDNCVMDDSLRVPETEPVPKR
jgi:hypothetical protein